MLDEALLMRKWDAHGWQLVLMGINGFILFSFIFLFIGGGGGSLRHAPYGIVFLYVIPLSPFMVWLGCSLFSDVLNYCFIHTLSFCSKFVLFCLFFYLYFHHVITKWKKRNDFPVVKNYQSVSCACVRVYGLWEEVSTSTSVADKFYTERFHPAFEPQILIAVLP